MRKRIIYGLWLLMAGGIVLSSCTKNDESTISLIGTEYYIDDLFSVIPDSIQTRFFADFGSVPQGPVPPKIEGSYIMDTMHRVASSYNTTIWPLSDEPYQVLIRFSHQHNGIATINMKQVSSDFSEVIESKTDTVFVCGSGERFTVYYVEDIKTEFWGIKRGVVIKGQKTDAGLSGFHYAQVILKSVDYSNGMFPPSPAGSYYIYKDKDGLTENYDW